MSSLLRAVLSLGKLGGVLVSHLWRAISDSHQQPRVVALVQPQVQASNVNYYDQRDYEPWACPKCGRYVTAKHQLHKLSVGRFRRCSKCRTMFTRSGTIVRNLE